jgi:hypothetical protein
MGEKNKFTLTPPILGYEDYSKCDNFIELVEEHMTAGEQRSPSGALREAHVTIHITLTFNSGACALSRITGQNFGTDLAQWNLWWSQNRGKAASVPASAAPRASYSSARPVSSPRMEDIAKGGTYRFTLTTGDEFKGVVETGQGRAYTFRKALTRSYEMISPPKKQNKLIEALRAGTVTQVYTLTFDEVASDDYTGIVLDVKIKSGSTFRGALKSVDEEMLRLDVDGSLIPIAKGVITQIATVPAEGAVPKKAPKKEPEGPLDTVIVRNPETDDYGRPRESIVHIGTIVDEGTGAIVMQMKDGTRLSIKRAQIERIKKHTVEGYEKNIARYAKPLFCPDDMVLVDIPPGKEGRPFLKVCIDKYEFPNTHDTRPQGNVSYAEAEKLCAARGKRLCTTTEWEWACSGLEAYTYPYGWNYDEEVCNTAGTDHLEASGTRRNCVSKFGAHDMVGNIFEWATDSNGNPMVMGGPYSKCQTVSPGTDGSAKPQTGLRCCKSN